MIYDKDNIYPPVPEEVNAFHLLINSLNAKVAIMQEQVN